LDLARGDSTDGGFYSGDICEMSGNHLVPQIAPNAHEREQQSRRQDEGPDSCTAQPPGKVPPPRPTAATAYQHGGDRNGEDVQEQAELFAGALGHAVDPLGALAAVYRDFARDRPHLYRLMTEQPLHRELLASGSEKAGSVSTALTLW
jgi:hypothetical protein